MKENIIKEKSFSFSLKIIDLYKELNGKNEYVISKQLLRSWTSIWANIVEWLHWQSKRDFLAKIYIAYKEANETRYWLELLKESSLTNLDLIDYLKEIDEIIRILWSITKTVKTELEK